MDPYDSSATRAVWSRVMQQDRAPEELSLEESLREMIAGEHTDHITYLAAARCAGRHAAALRQIAMQEDCHGKRLQALYYLLTGECYAPEVAPKCEGSFCETLRARFAVELEGAKRYRAAAERWPEHRCLFLELAAQEENHGRILHGIACQRMKF